MLSRWETDRQFAARALALKAENLLPARLQAEAEQAGGGMSPAEILRGLQEQQNASVITQVMPGPQAWGDYELPLPGASQAQRDRAVKGDPVTPQHSAAEGAMEAAGETGPDVAERRRRRVQHLAEPYPDDPPEVDCVDVGELGKLRTQAVDVPVGYPPMRPADAEQFRRRPATEDHAAYSPGYGAPGQAVPVPSASLAPGMATRPLLADGRSRPCAPEAC